MMGCCCPSDKSHAAQILDREAALAEQRRLQPSYPIAVEWGRLETEQLGAVSLSLKYLDLRNQYRSDRHNLLEFYIPCLERSLTYDRAVGFFSSSSLAAAAKGVTAND